MSRFRPEQRPWIPGAPFLFVFAGCSVIVAIFTGSVLWGGCIVVGLAMILVATIASLNGLRRPLQALPQAGLSAVAPSRRLLQVLFAAVLIHLIASALTLHFLPGKAIDCYTFQRDAAIKLFHGINPYGTVEPDYYTPQNALQFYGPYVLGPHVVKEGMPYTPLTLLWTLPGAALGDIRISYVVAILISGLLLFWMRPGVRSSILSAFLLLDPMTFFIESRSWTEPLSLMLLTATAYATVRKRWWLPIALGLFLVGKQYNILALPFVFLLVPERNARALWKLIAQALAVAAATFLPFAWHHVHALWHDLVLFHMAMPYRPDALTTAVLFPAILKFWPWIVLTLILWLVMKGMPSRNPGLFAAAYGVTLLIFIAVNKQGFDNYYFLAAHAFMISAVALPQTNFWTSDANKVSALPSVIVS